ncbi:response regulator [Hassallia byssoidea VB512170]|uniref:Response regulator n=1 Tax=Hassallia byssoidea VB512170 TaxID=1304833 RepID=A0A846H726_9CYAN|nr:response regulator [Hassalia byssoidea]NEU72419.1 response regulator [Hassalia byssoidea VB512170]
MESLDLPSDSQVKRILVVDDTPDNLFLIETVLQAEGYQVEVADNGQDALSMIEAEPPALLLLDVMMPGMHGYEVVQCIRQNTNLPFIPIILITGCEQLDTSEQFDVAVEGFICKPIDFDELLKQVSTILAMKDSSANAFANQRLAS